MTVYCGYCGVPFKVADPVPNADYICAECWDEFFEPAESTEGFALIPTEGDND